MPISPPSGLDDIIATFGSLDIPDFEARNIVAFNLPYPLYYDGQQVTRSRCHHLMVEPFVAVFSELLRRGLKDQAQNYGGIYNKRPIRGQQAHPSTHSWGIAIDLEPARYPLGSGNRFSPEVVAVFKDGGFVYGGDFMSRKDPMHFQFCSNY